MEERTTWEEYMYWNHIRSLSFFRVLDAGFSTQLAIPKRFYHNLRGKLPSTVTLKGRSGATWNVNLTTKNDILFLQDGWEKFATAYSLKENDMLVFNYNNGDCFDVLIYDGKTLCERETSYFVQNIGISSPTKARHSEKKRRRDTIGGGEIPSAMKNSRRVEVGECSTRKFGGSEPIMKNSKRVDFGQCSARKTSEQVSWSEDIEVLSDDDNGDRDSEQRTASRELARKAEGGKGIAGILEREVQSARGRKNGKGKSGGKNYNFPTVHNPSLIRKPATEEQKMEALKMAEKSASTPNSFFIIIKPSHVTHSYQMCLPAGWVKKYFSRRNQYVYIQYEEKKWRFRYNSRSSGGVLVSGWREFARAHSIQESDVCVFKLSRQKHEDCVLMDVIIHYSGEVIKNS